MNKARKVRKVSRIEIFLDVLVVITFVLSMYFAIEYMNASKEFKREVAIITLHNVNGPTTLNWIPINPETDPVLNPNYFDGYDFTEFNSGEKSLLKLVDVVSYDSLKLIVVNQNGVDTILGDGNLFTQHEECGVYKYFLYAPKKVAEVSAGDAYRYITVSHVPENEEIGCKENFIFTFMYCDEAKGENIPLPVEVLYEDGSRETITIYITKNY